jgi:eukaryotic-like serine/threonine-protein kinase
LDTPTSGPGSVVLRDRYRPTELIARGGMSSVYRAHDEFLDRDVAVKIFQAISPEQIEVGKQELRVLAGLSHHGLITLLDAGVDQSEPDDPHIFLVMELVESSTLAQRIADGALSSRDAGYIGYDIAEGLEYVHQRGIVHRDVKPANILLADYSDESVRPRARLTDFGIAAFEAAQQPNPPGRTVGTAGYLSPEQARGAVLTSATDTYSLGLVLLEALTGCMAFEGDIQTVVGERTRRDPVIPETLNDRWRLLLAGMTAQNPADRPPMRDVILALRRIIVDDLGKHRASEEIEAEDEASRLEAVRRYDVLDTPPDGAFDRVTSLAARIFRVPVAIVSIVDHDRIWFKSHHGVEIDEIERSPGLCASAILNNEPWVVTDARTDPRALTNPLVAGEFGLQFYAGVPLRTTDGHALGTLCVLDFEPREITADELESLKDLAAIVMSELEIRLAAMREREQSQTPASLG